MALLLPSLSNARESARKAKCLSNIHQLGIALTGYALDNNGNFYYYPLSGDHTYDASRSFPSGQIVGSQYQPWEGLSNYVVKTSILYCPSVVYKNIAPSSYDPAFHPNTVQPWGSLVYSDTHYGYMEFMNLDVPKNYILIFESPYLYGHSYFYNSHGGSASVVALDMGSGNTYAGASGGNSSPVDGAYWGVYFGSTPPAPTAHYNGTNVGYVDGHVEWQSGPRLKWFYFYDDWSNVAAGNGYPCRGTY